MHRHRHGHDVGTSVELWHTHPHEHVEEVHQDDYQYDHHWPDDHDRQPVDDVKIVRRGG